MEGSLFSNQHHSTLCAATKVRRVACHGSIMQCSSTNGELPKPGVFSHFSSFTIWFHMSVRVNNSPIQTHFKYIHHIRRNCFHPAYQDKQEPVYEWNLFSTSTCFINTHAGVYTLELFQSVRRSQIPGGYSINYWVGMCR